MNVEITWGDDLPSIPRNENSSCVVIDVLRASTSVAVLLHRGARLVKIVKTVDDALALKCAMPDAILCGERGGLPPAGFDFGNSPVEFSTASVSGKDVILTTTNFTRIAVEAISKGFPYVYCGAFVNRSAVAKGILEEARETGNDLLLVAAGVKQTAYEDLVGAMYMAKHLRGLDGNLDIRFLAGLTWDGVPFDALPEQHAFILSLVKAGSRHASFLGSLGPRFQEDVSFSLQLDTVPGVLPRFDHALHGFINGA